mmetsp:Transcript_24670/g.44616  ORF Transcript_24670/g.44616 Transcript_24670/m.44616 type:complete len:256 (-) Transcript_24670:196-963(-)
MLKRCDAIDVNVQQSQKERVLATTGNVVIVHTNAHSKSTTLLQVQHLRIKDGRQPVSSKDGDVVKDLKAMHPSTSRMIERIIVKQEHGFGAKAVGVLFCMISIRVVCPMLFQPEPFRSSNEICSQSKNIIDPWFLGGSSVIGVMLHIQTNKGLRNTIEYCQPKGRSIHDPQILESKEESNVEKGARKVSGRTKLSSTTDNLEDFLFNLSFKRSIKFVFAFTVRDCADTLHLFQMLGSMMRMNHFVLHSNIISTKE